MSNKLNPYTFIPNSDYNVKTEVYNLALPKGWLDKLNILQQMATKRENVRIPIKSLNAVMQALFPEIIRVERNAFYPGSNWLLSTRAIDVNIIFEVIRAWLATEFSHVDKQLLKKVTEQMDASHLQWQKMQINLCHYSIHQNRTAKPEDGYFNAIPAYMCNKFISNDIKLSLGHERLSFERAGDELISWPPINYKNWYYSLGLKFEVQTMPFFKVPVIIMQTSTKRWVSNNLNNNGFIKLPKDNNTTIYLRSRAYWYDREQESGFSQVKAKFNYKSEDKVLWANRIAEIISRLQLNIKLPPVTEIISEPVKYLTGHQGISAGIVYSEAINSNHRIGTGINLCDKKELFEQVAEHFPELQKMPTPNRIIKPMKSNALLNNWKTVAPENRCSALSKIIGPKLNLEITYSSTDIRNELLKAINEFFFNKGEPIDEGCYIYETLTINITTSPIGEWGSGIKPAENELSRIADIKKDIPFTSEPTGVIVELEDKNNWNGNDPKMAIRKGLARTGRLSQFITPSDDEEKTDKLENRCRNAVLDLLRQLGYLPSSPKTVLRGKNTVPESFGIFGIWLITSKKYKIEMPVAVYMHSDSLEIDACYPGAGEWKSYRQVLLEVANLTQERELKYTNEQIINFVKRIINLEANQVKPAVIFMESYNIRRKWSWIQDGRISKNEVWFNDKRNAINADQFSGIRIIRTRDCDEVPVWYGEGKNGEARFTTGLFKATDYNYWSIPRKPKTYKKINSTMSKVEHPTKYFKTPRMIEITPVILDETDSPAEWAMLTHKMRDMLFYYDEYVNLPVALHLAKGIQDYLKS